jgi:copper chaperone CopZ
MHCAGCESTVQFTLSRLPGVENVKADHQDQRISLVLTSPETDFEKIKADLEWIGYRVEEL